MVLDAFLLITLHYQVRIKGMCSNLGQDAVPSPVAVEKGAFGSLSTKVGQLTWLTIDNPS